MATRILVKPRPDHRVMMLTASAARRHAVGVNEPTVFGESSEQGDTVRRSGFMLRPVTEMRPRPTAGM
jgi:hypothetical protein